MISRVLWAGLLALTFLGSPQTGFGQGDSYDVLLHSQLISDQRMALTALLDHPQEYMPRIRQDLQGYPQLLRTDPMAAKRAVYISAFVRDPSLAPILAKSLGVGDVLDQCEYACPVVFALTIQACFNGWSPPSNLDSKLTTVYDLQREIHRVPHLSLKIGSIENVVQGRGLEEHRKEIEGKTEEQLIQMAGPMTSSIETRMFAAFRLETLITRSKNRIDLYLLALNDFEDGSGEYRSAVYESIYRAEVAMAHGQ